MAIFDQAWDIVKMPLDRDSIMEVGDDEVHAEFIHPDFNPLRMVVRDLSYRDGPASFVSPAGHVSVRLPPTGRNPRGEVIAEAGYGLPELETGSGSIEAAKQWLEDYGGNQMNEWEMEDLIDMYRDSGLGDPFNTSEEQGDLHGMVGGYSDQDNQAVIRNLASFMGRDVDPEAFLDARKYTTEGLYVNPAWHRMGIGSSMYDLLAAIGRRPTPSMNQDLRGRLMWLKNQGITDHRFGPESVTGVPYKYPNALPKGKRKRRIGDIMYDYSRLGSEEPPRWILGGA